MKLTQILQEITLGGVKPYQTRFAWKHMGWRHESSFEIAPGLQVEFILQEDRDADDALRSEPGYTFTFVTPREDEESPRKTVHHSDAQRGRIDYLRLLATTGEALLDFCAQYSPAWIDVSAYDKYSAARSKKHTIYLGLLRANQSRLAAAGYRILVTQQNKIYLTRTSNTDSTGIKD